MKQNFPTARSRRINVNICVLVTIALLCSACATLPQQRYLTQVSLHEPPLEKGPRININAATAPELEKLPGVGKVIAARIIEHRTKYGPFRRTEHVMMVRGISDQKFRDLRGLITTE